jgi:hypothetical protein
MIRKNISQFFSALLLLAFLVQFFQTHLAKFIVEEGDSIEHSTLIDSKKENKSTNEFESKALKILSEMQASIALEGLGLTETTRFHVYSETYISGFNPTNIFSPPDFSA